MKNILKQLILLVAAGVFSSSAAVQLVLDDWQGNMNRTGAGTNQGHWAAYTAAGDVGNLIFIAGGQGAGITGTTVHEDLDGIAGSPTGFDTRPTQNNYDGLGANTFSAGTWYPGNDPSDGSVANGQVFRLQSQNATGTQNRFHFALINATSSDMIINDIGYSARNQFNANHPNHLRLSYVDSTNARFNSELIKTSADGLSNLGELVDDETVTTTENITPLDYTSWSANGTKVITHDLASIVGSTVKLAPGTRAAFELAWIGSRDSVLADAIAAPDYNAGPAQTQFDMMVINATVVPEPSTYALIAGFAAFLFVAIKRRK
jgi:hypothetical protein